MKSTAFAGFQWDLVVCFGGEKYKAEESANQSKFCDEYLVHNDISNLYHKLTFRILEIKITNRHRDSISN